MKARALVILIFFAVCTTGSAQNTIRVDALKGKFVYHKSQFLGYPIWVRPDPNQKHAKHPDIWKRKQEPENARSTAIAEITNKIIVEPRQNPLKTDQEIWDQFRKTWLWSVQNMRQNITELKKLKTTNQNNPSLHDHAVAMQKLGYLPSGTCGSVSNLFIQLLIQGGVPTNRVAMAQATYPNTSTPGGTASHAYVILFVNGKWLYLDPNARMTNKELPEKVTDARSAGYPKNKGVEYQWPFDTTFYQPHPFDGKLPLVNN